MVIPLESAAPEEAAGQSSTPAALKESLPATDSLLAARLSDVDAMRLALLEAEAAARDGDVPVGAVIVGATGVLLARGRNLREREQDPTAHAEIGALRAATRALGTWRLVDATVYATLEPCPMCAGALLQARVARVVYGCPDPKAGAIDTLYSIGRDARLNHHFAVTSGVLADECAAVLRHFFAARRRPAPRDGRSSGG